MCRQPRAGPLPAPALHAGRDRNRGIAINRTCRSPSYTPSFKPALLALGNRERGTDITRWKGCRVGLSSMMDTATALLGLLSVSIFLAHALDAYNAK